MITQLGINNLFCFDYCVNSGFPNSLYNFTTFARKWGFPVILHKIQFRLFNGHDNVNVTENLAVGAETHEAQSES